MPESQIRVLVATKSAEVRRLLEQRGDVHFEIAVHTSAIKKLLPDAHLVIVDYEDLVEYELSEAEIREEIFAARVYECTSSDFCNAPDTFLGGAAINRPGRMLGLPSRYCIAFVSYSGGTGRTTLALDSAFQYAESVGKPIRASKPAAGQPANSSAVLLVELTYGVSSLVSLTGLTMSSISQLATDPDAQMQQYRGVSLLPMDYAYARLLPNDLLRRYLGQQMDRHQLTLIDCIWPHGLAEAVRDRVDLWIIVATERPDALVNAQRLYSELTAFRPEQQVWLLLNRATHRKGNSMLEWQIQLPLIAKADEFRGELGSAILSAVYAPIWQRLAKEKGR
jgi:hypothetical protein